MPCWLFSKANFLVCSSLVYLSAKHISLLTKHLTFSLFHLLTFLYIVPIYLVVVFFIDNRAFVRLLLDLFESLSSFHTLYRKLRSLRSLHMRLSIVRRHRRRERHSTSHLMIYLLIFSYFELQALKPRLTSFLKSRWRRHDAAGIKSEYNV